MGDVINLFGEKQKKLDKKILEDINNILLVINYTTRALNIFRHYGAVLEIIMLLEANRKMLELNKEKYEKKINSIPQN